MFNSLANKKILLGVTGSIAAYKICELVRELKKAGAFVRVVLTSSAKEFVTPMTLQALSGERVWTDLLDEEAEAAMGHIELARWADFILVAPASADLMARLASGRADDLLTTLCLASKAPIAIAPAMNQQMWLNETTQKNLTLLQEKQVKIWGPGDGEQACGEFGPGRMLEVEELLFELSHSFSTGSLAGHSVLITAGPTCEPIDPLRYITNHSSGKMGYALAISARDAGAKVLLITGPTHLTVPEGIECVQIKTAAQMYDAVMSSVKDHSIYISAAAIADYTPVQTAPEKIKKADGNLSLELKRTKDVLSSVADLSERPFLVGFAAETKDLLDYAKGKLKAKKLDMIVANLVGENVGYQSDENEVTICFSSGESLELPKQSKQLVANQIVEQVAMKLSEKVSTHPHS